jgi:PAS domain S-box-containing protein
MDSTFELNAEGLERILSTIPEFLIVLDREGRIRYVNHIEEGYDRAAVIGTSAEAMVSPDSIENFRSAVRSVRETGEMAEYEVDVTAPDGSRQWYRSRMLPLGSDAPVDLLLLVSSNVTELKAAQEETEKLRQLLPICAWCGRIRTDGGDWESIERYLSRTAGNRVTHGMCGDCADRQFDDRDNKGGTAGAA